MRKLIILALAIIALLSATSCTQKPAITLTPSEVTVKVGEKVQLHPGFEGNVDETEMSRIIRIVPDDGIAYLDNYYFVIGLKVGNTKVGVGIYNNPDDPSQGYKYTAFTTVHVVN